MYDVIIIGGGVIGGMIARSLMRYDCSVLILEKHNDVGEETSSANSAIVHSGYDPKPGTNKAKFNVLGNKMMGEVAKDLDVPFKRIGSLTVAFSPEEVDTLRSLKERAIGNGVKARIVEGDELKELEPNLSNEALTALFCEDSGIVDPFLLTVSAFENAIDNGAKLLLNEEVISIGKIDGGYSVKTISGEEFVSHTLIDAAGLYSDKIVSLLEEPNFKITPRKGEYVVLDHFSTNWIKHTLFMVPNKVGKGVLVSPTTSYNYLIGPSNDESSEEDVSVDPSTIEEIKNKAAKLVKNIPYTETIKEFAGVRANTDNGDFIIEESKINLGFYIVGGIMSPGLASSPAIGEYVADMIKKRLNLDLNLKFNPKIRPHFHLGKSQEYLKMIAKDERYGHMICRCEKVSEGEIVDAIKRNCGARNIKGVRKRLRAGFGRCQGSFCQEEIARILARELDVPLNEVLYGDIETPIVEYPSKEKR
jgi:glycerol-3-phosphate dehydrogenase